MASWDFLLCFFFEGKAFSKAFYSQTLFHSQTLFALVMQREHLVQADPISVAGMRPGQGDKPEVLTSL